MCRVETTRNDGERGTTENDGETLAIAGVSDPCHRAFFGVFFFVRNSVVRITERVLGWPSHSARWPERELCLGRKVKAEAGVV